MPDEEDEEGEEKGQQEDEEHQHDDGLLPCCYVCDESTSTPTNRLLVDVCSCKYMTLHIDCQRKMVRTSGRRSPMHCPICDEPYRNVKPSPSDDGDGHAETLSVLVVGNSVFSLLMVSTSRLPIPEQTSSLSTGLLVAEGIAWCCVLVDALRKLRRVCGSCPSPVIVSVLLLATWQPSVVAYLLVTRLSLVECVVLLVIVYLITFMGLFVLWAMPTVERRRQQQGAIYDLQ
jgi:hypothetical protein